MDDNAFENFTHSVAAARLLLEQAQKRGSLIEGLALYASLIDALLRNLVALKTGERDGTTIRLDLRFFYHDVTKFMNEREVYAQARSCGVLNDAETRELEELYAFRNRVIHRFIISGISYVEIAPKLDEYEVIYRRTLDQLRAIEQPDGHDPTDDAIAQSRKRVARKIGGARLDDA